MSEVYIVGGGPSLKGFDFEKLRNKTTIVVNKALMDVPNADYFITMDEIFLSMHPRMIRDYGQSVTTILIVNLAPPKRVERNLRLFNGDIDRVINSPEEGGLGSDWSSFRNGRNSGFCALQFAILEGFTEIYLMGIDLEIKDNETHYHSGYNKAQTCFLKRNMSDYEAFWKVGLAALEYREDIKVYSCSPNNSLKLKYKSLESL